MTDEQKKKSTDKPIEFPDFHRVGRRSEVQKSEGPDIEQSEVPIGPDVQISRISEQQQFVSPDIQRTRDIALQKYENFTHPEVQTGTSPDIQRARSEEWQTSRTAEHQQSKQVDRQTAGESKVQRSKHPDWKQKTIYLPPGLVRWLNMQAAYEDREQSDIVTEALEAYRRSRRGPTV